MFNQLLSLRNKTDNPSQPSSLAVDVLENRMMLSSVQIFAAGTTGTESLDLRINDVVVKTFEHVGGDASNRQFQQLTFDTPQNITAGEVRLEFTNDLFRPEDGFDRNIVIDRIVVDGVTFETESPSTFSTGVFKDGGVTDPGFLQTETLNINGSFFYSNDGASAPTASTGTTLQIKAFGSTGEEQLQIRINGNVVQTFSVTTTPDTYTFVSDQQISVDQVQVEFTNDLFDPNSGIDRNLIVEQIQLVDRQTNETQTFITDSNSTFSTGTYLAADGIVDGFGRGNTLHANGFFRFAQSDAPTDPNTSTDSLAIDLSFGEDGFTSGNNANFSSESAVSPSGRFARIGFSGGLFDGTSSTDLLLFDADGTLINQTSIAPGGRQQPRIQAIEFGLDESIFVSLDASRSPISQIVKLTPEGNRDTSFGTDGTLTRESIERASLAVTSDGNLITGGRIGVLTSAPQTNVLTKRDPQGNLIDTFGGDGRVELNFGTEIIGTVATSDGGAYFAVNDGQTGSRTVTRISADGSLVSSFGFNGSIFLEPQGFGTDVVLVDSQDRLILGNRIFGDDGRTQLLRFNSDGQIDTSFGDGGTVTLSTDSFGFEVDSQDRIAGFTNVQVNSNLTASIFRLNENGDFDASFADGGVFVTADVPSSEFNQQISGIELADDGSIFANSFFGIRKYIPV